MGNRHPCDRPVYDGERCIFHSTRIEKDLELFNRELDDLLRRDQTLDCTSFIVPEKALAFEDRTFSWDVSFRHAVFLGPCAFRGSQFMGKADFTGARFTRAEFAEVHFDGAALFARGQFHGDTTFAGARFQDMLSCHQVHFAGSANFSQIRVGGRADFSRAEFAAVVLFGGSRFRAGVNFGGAQFQQKAGFNRARFADEVYFSETKFPGGQEGEHETRVEMTEVSFERPDKVHFYLVDAGRVSFLKTQLQRVDFTDVAWARRKSGRAALWDELRPEGTKDYAEVARLYRQLRANFEKEGDHRAAADFRYGQMEMRRMNLGSGNPASRFLNRTFSLLTCYKMLSDYGENPSRAGAWILAAVVLFGLLFAAAGFDEGSPLMGGNDWVARVGAGLRAGVAALTLQTGHLVASLSGFGHWLAVLGGIIGPLLLIVWGLAVARSTR
jgi:uncharacterized protein YjbI with pentapeptide repeats